jgi:hypothetical protein
MKKITIITTLIFLFTSMLLAGEFSSRGMKLGINSAKVIGKDIPGKGVSAMPGFAVGGFFSYQFNEKFAIQPECFVTTKGTKINTIGDLELVNMFIYFEFPVLVKMTFYSERRVKPTIFAGPALALKYFALNNTGVLEDIRSTDFGLIFGAGVEFWKLSFDVRYNRGMVNFDKSEDDIDLKNSAFSFMIGYSF